MTGLFVVAVIAACQDAPTDPVAGLVAEESHAALVLGMAFPDPESWLPEDDAGAAAQVLGQWRESWDLPADQGRARRAALYDELARALAPGLTFEAVRGDVDLLGEGVLRARALTGAEAEQRLHDGIDAAARHHDAASAALDAGDPVGAVRHLIQGGDDLREVGPEAVARTLVGEAEAALRRISEGDSYSDRDLERTRRLVRGGREAIDEGDWILAIRRAYYAKGLLNGNG